MSTPLSSPSPSSSPPSSTLRQRNVPTSDDSSTVPTTRAVLLRTFKQLDYYPKTEEENVTKTHTGGLITLITLSILLILFVSELYRYISVSTSHSISVDTSRDQRIDIDLDISFPAIPCDKCELDVMDVAGESSEDAYREIWKTHLNYWGQEMGQKFKEDHEHEKEHGNDVTDPNHPKNPNVPSLIFNGQNMIPNPMASRTLSPSSNSPPSSSTITGCNLRGHIKVKKVAGNLHLAVGAMHTPDHRHVHQFLLQDLLSFNSSHVIHSLRFGPPLPSSSSFSSQSPNPLESTSQILKPGTPSAHFQYYLKLVPTVYSDVNNVSVSSYQYSVTSQTHYLSALDTMRPDGRRIPGVFFLYEMSPFLLQMKEKSIRFTEFLVSCCAILGGIFTVAGVVDSLLHQGVKVFGWNLNPIPK